MLPESLASTYQQYKKDTGIFTSWLSKAAVACGYQFKNEKDDFRQNTETTGPTNSQSGRLKGKERKAAKASNTKTSSTVSGKPITNSTTFTIPISQLLSQAKLVACSPHSKFKVPRLVILALKRAISARKDCAAWYRSNQSMDQSDNEGHKVFIQALEEIAVVLSTKLKSQDATNSLPITNTGTADDNELSNNKFSALTIHDTGDDDDGTPLEVTLPKKHAALASASFELESPQDKSGVFAAICLLKDMVSFRNHLTGVWERCKRGEISHLTASTITTAAIHLFESQERKFADISSFLVEEPGDHFLPFLKLIHSVLSTQSTNLPHLLDVNQILSFFSIYATLDEFRVWMLDIEESKKVERPSSEETQTRGKYYMNFIEHHSPVLILLNEFEKFSSIKQHLSKESTNRKRLDAEVTRFEKLVLEHILAYDDKFYSCGCLSTYKIPDDPMSKEIEEVIHGGTITLSSMLACRVMMDAQDAVGESKESIYNALCNDSVTAIQRLDRLPCPKECCDCMTFRDGWSWINEQDRELGLSAQRLHRTATRNSPDGSHFSRVKQHCLEQLPPESELEKLCQESPMTITRMDPDTCYYLKHNIIQSGLTRLFLKLDLESIGIALEDQYWSIVSVSHLYNLGKQLKLIQEPWEELEQIIELQQTTLFGSVIPLTPAAAYNCFLRRMRIPATCFSKDYRSDCHRVEMKPAALPRNRAFELCRSHFVDGQITIEQFLYRLGTLAVSSKKDQPFISHSSDEHPLVTVLLQAEGCLEAELCQAVPDWLGMTRKCIMTMVRIMHKLEDKVGIEFDECLDGCRTGQRNTWVKMTSDLLRGVDQEMNGVSKSHFSRNFEPHNREYFHLYTLQTLKVALKVLQNTYNGKNDEGRKKDWWFVDHEVDYRWFEHHESGQG